MGRLLSTVIWQIHHTHTLTGKYALAVRHSTCCRRFVCSILWWYSFDTNRCSLHSSMDRHTDALIVQQNSVAFDWLDWTGLGDNNVEWFFILFVRQTTHHSAGIKTRMLYANGIESVFVTKASISWYLALTGRRFKNIK